MSEADDLAEHYKRLRGASQTIFRSPEGELVLTHLRRFCCGDRSTHTPGDSHHTAFLEGRRNVLLEIETLMTVEDSQIAKIAKRKGGYLSE